jgi:hypothetical protein
MAALPGAHWTHETTYAGRMRTYADVCIYTAGLLGAHWKHETTVRDDFGSFTGAHALYWYKSSRLLVQKYKY